MGSSPGRSSSPSPDRSPSPFQRPEEEPRSPSPSPSPGRSPSPSQWSSEEPRSPSPSPSPGRSPSPSQRSSEEPGSSERDDEERLTYIKFLVSNLDAGSIIGRGGSTISELQSDSGARIQLSRKHACFPGTMDRIILISGYIDEILKATSLILEKLSDEAEESSDAEVRSEVRLVVPNSSCGGIIGGGSTIRNFVEESHARIKISPQDNFIGLNDRLVTVTGSLDECMEAIELIITKLVEDGHYSRSAVSSNPHAGVNFSGVHGIPCGYAIPPVGHNTTNHVPNNVGRRYPGNEVMRLPAPARRAPDGQGISVTIGIPDEYIGAIIGRGGRNISKLVQASGTRIKISDRSDFIPGTKDRKITITGPREAVRATEDVIMRTASALSER